jgi:predicted SnoaL-like aldol condensation-catalyzing enzyme
MTFSDPTQTEAAFYAAFRHLDIGQMKDVWLDSAKASCVHPGGGLLQGIDAVLASWGEIFRDSQPPQVEYRLVQAIADAGLAVHTVEEFVSSGSGERRARVLATNVYRYVDGSWWMLAHHASLPLVETTATRHEKPLH